MPGVLLPVHQAVYNTHVHKLHPDRAGEQHDMGLDVQHGAKGGHHHLNAPEETAHNKCCVVM
jgi:hypothetical protein